jgi:predicted anti-sigma-YlaC factor YlaD
VQPDERTVRLTCAEVLAALSEYVDGAVPAELAAGIEAHVAGCQGCAAFGRGFAVLLAAMRRQLAAPEPVPAEVATRLRVSLERAADG